MHAAAPHLGASRPTWWCIVACLAQPGDSGGGSGRVDAVTLSNGVLSIALDAGTGALASIAAPGSVPFHFQRDSWSIRVHAENETGVESLLSPSNCTAAPLAPVAGNLSWTVEFTCRSPTMTRSAFLVRAGYQLWPGQQFVTRELKVCQAKLPCHGGSCACDDGAQFFVATTTVWDGLLPADAAVEGPHHSLNPYAAGKEQNVIASFWRRPQHADGIFASVQNPFFMSGPPPPPPPPAPHHDIKWMGKTWRTYNPGVTWSPSAAGLAVRINSKIGAGFDEAVLPSALPTGLGTSAVSVSFSSKQDGCAGLLVGAQAARFGPGANTFAGYEVSLSPVGGGYVVLVYHDNDSTQLKREPVSVPLNTAVALEVVIAPPPAGQDGTSFRISVGGKLALSMTDHDHRSHARGAAVAVRTYEIDAVFSKFSAKPSAVDDATADESSTPDVAACQPVLMKYDASMLHDARSMGLWHTIDLGVLGLTELSAYSLPETGTNLGESQAFVQCVQQFMLDGEMRETKALRYNAAWDCDEYQLDMSHPADVTEYERIIDRNAQIGILNQVYEPRNTAVSSRFNATDDWEWEQVLMFQMNEDFRLGKWKPGEALPPTVASMMQYFKSKGVRPTAYFYPILNFQAPGADWLYPFPGVSGQRATLASVKLQDYLIESLSTFMNQTGAIGFAWDYTFFSDTNHSVYSQWRGWTRITTSLRRLHPDMVCDNRQTAHVFGPWYHFAGSFAEPIAGDENPESYGAALASLSTDHVLANNLRVVNYLYRQQLLPNSRIPGFIFHQPERQYDNNTGTDPGHMQVWTRWHVRDFDHPGWRYSVWSTVGTAPLNLITANIPARDPEEHAKFSAKDVAWWQSTYTWVDTNLRFLNQTQALPGYGSPSVTALDGTSAMAGDEGFLFLFNSGPLTRSALLCVDEMIGLTNVSVGASWMVTELYPLEPPEGGRSPVALWEHGERVEIPVGGTQVRVLQLTKMQAGRLRTKVPALAGARDEAYAFNISYSRAVLGAGVLSVFNATALAGTVVQVLLTARTKPSSVEINGKPVAVEGPWEACAAPALQGWFCAKATLRFHGTSLAFSQKATDTAPPPDLVKGWFNSTFTISSSMLAQLERSQAAYPINWTDADMDATWLAPNRLLLYPFIVSPVADMEPIRAWVDGKPLAMLPAYNSRGNHKSKGCFLGWYANMTGVGIAPDVSHSLDLHVDLSALAKPAGSLLGVFWQNLANEYAEY